MSETLRDDSRKPATPLRPAQAGALAAGFGRNQPLGYSGKAGRSGPPAGNTNAVRHGLKGGKLPKGCQYIEHRVNALRRQVEEAVLDVKGEITLVDAAMVNSILKWERHGLLAQHWLRHEADKLSASDRLRFSEAIARASDNRDRAIKALGLDAPPKPVTLGDYIAEKHNGESDEHS